ncbi:MAG: DUF3365 domain-containing protein [Chromatiales bacterium]|nr:DUF3365 domain-containing protein [Chromatiales bacterium]
MNLRLKFNLILLATGLVGLTVAGVFTHRLLQQHAEQEVLEQANMMMESALAVRKYTVDELRPLLRKVPGDEFLPQTVPAYAASRYVAALQKNHPDYGYKEAALNPSNPSNRATDWEADIIEWFRTHPQADQLTGARETPIGPSFYYSRPIRITDGACLSCHDRADNAPKAVVARYGAVNGFGWKMNETVGAQVVSVPQSLPFERARQAFYLFMAMLAGVFVLVGVVMNVLLSRLVIRPIEGMARHAEELSQGKLAGAELKVRGSDELAQLGRSINLMQRSLGSAMDMLNETLGPRR